MNDEQNAARVSALHAIAATGDDIAPTYPEGMSGTERVARLLEDAGDIALDLRLNGGGDLDACLLHLAAGALLWLEARTTGRDEGASITADRPHPAPA